VEIVCWVAESKRLFKVVSDCGFQSLMKTGRLGYYIPSLVTVSRDVKKVFANTRKWIVDDLNTTQTPECSKGKYNAKIIKRKSLRRSHQQPM
jgi:hypothetical protein